MISYGIMILYKADYFRIMIVDNLTGFLQLGVAVISVSGMFSAFITELCRSHSMIFIESIIE